MSYGDEPMRERMEQGMNLVLSHSTSIPLRPLIRPLRSLVQRFGCNASDIAFWLVLSRHPALEPQDCLILIELLSSVAITTAVTALNAGLAFISVVADRVRHNSVMMATSSFIKQAFDVSLQRIHSSVLVYFVSSMDRDAGFLVP